MNCCDIGDGNYSSMFSDYIVVFIVKLCKHLITNVVAESNAAHSHQRHSVIIPFVEYD